MSARRRSYIPAGSNAVIDKIASPAARVAAQQVLLPGGDRAEPRPVPAGILHMSLPGRMSQTGRPGVKAVAGLFSMSYSHR